MQLEYINQPVNFELIKEIGVLNEQEGAADATVITEATNRSLSVATTRFFPDFFNPGGAINPDYFNKTLDQIGTNFFGFTNLLYSCIALALVDPPAVQT